MSAISQISASDAYKAIAETGGILVDVRTQAEWMFVGVPDLSQIGSRAIFLEWQSLPAMQINLDFPRQLAEAVTEAGGNTDTPLYFLCRSGARSMSAAQVMTEAGYSTCYNIADGFEGPLDGARHRNVTAGWRASGLPWVQS